MVQISYNVRNVVRVRIPVGREKQLFTLTLWYVGKENNLCVSSVPSLSNYLYKERLCRLGRDNE